MAKKRRSKTRTKKRASKKRASKRKPNHAKMAERLKNASTRVALHQAATKLADFHGGKSPIRSGCGRPRKK